MPKGSGTGAVRGRCREDLPHEQCRVLVRALVLVFARQSAVGVVWLHYASAEAAGLV